MISGNVTMITDAKMMTHGEEMALLPVDLRRKEDPGEDLLETGSVTEGNVIEIWITHPGTEWMGLGIGVLAGTDLEVPREGMTLMIQVIGEDVALPHLGVEDRHPEFANNPPDGHRLLVDAARQ